MTEIGLFPLAQGTLHHVINLRICRRFIPARAGNPRKRAIIRLADAVYPRSRKEPSKYNPLNYRIIYHSSNSTDFIDAS